MHEPLRFPLPRLRREVSVRATPCWKAPYRTTLCRATLSAALLLWSGAQAFTPSFQDYRTFSQRSVGYVAATVTPVFVPQAVAQATRPDAAAPQYRSALQRSDFTFRGSPTQQQTCAAMATQPADQRQMAALCLRLYGLLEAQPDFRKHNLAAALGVLIGLSLQVSRGDALNGGEGLDEVQSDLLIRGLNDLLVEGGVMNRPPADLQATYERSLMLGGLIVTLYQQGQESGDAQLGAAAKVLADGVLASFGVKP